MRFGPSFSLAAVNALSKAGGTSSNALPPADSREIPDGILPLPQARFDDQSGWTLDTSWSDAGSAVRKVPGSTNEYVTSGTISIPAGDIWVGYSVWGATAGTVGVQLQGPFANTPFMNKVTAQHVARFSGPAHTKMRILGNLAFDGTVEDIQAVDMTALLAQPSDIYIAAGQSLIAAESKSTPVDPELDFWVPRCLYVPGVTNNTYGAVQGVPAACVAPLQMAQAAQGVSPATTFAREIEKVTPAGRTVLIVACGKGGTRIVGDSAEWNPDATSGDGATLYNNMVSQVQAALALNPGNTVKGLIWGQGESDRNGTIDVEYPPPFTSMVTQLRSALSEPDLPVILLGPMPDDQLAVQPLFIQTQERLDQDSGHPTAVPGVHYVERPPGYLSADGTHPVPEGSRIAGRLGAARFIAEGYI